MSKNLRYYGEFVSRDGNRYRIEILQEGTWTAEEVFFSADEPATIEWAEVNKIDPVQSSCLTLTLDSDTDRRFIDLYTIEVGTVRANVYRNGTLYWSGTLDPELYEEPYSSLKHYDVTLSFTDFAMLERRKWSSEGIMSIDEVLHTCLESLDMQYGEIVKYISTSATAESEALTLSDVNISCANFYDEDNEPMSMRDVVDGVLQPFALRMVQRAGRVFIYDLNAIHSSLEGCSMVWNDTDAALNVDDVYNNVKVTFSPYSDSTVMQGAVESDDNPTPSDNAIYVKVPDRKTPGFFVNYGHTPKSNLKLSNGAVFYQIGSQYSGSDEAGVAYSMRPETTEYLQSVGKLVDDETRTTAAVDYNTQPIITCPLMYINPQGVEGKYVLEVTMQILLDVRYNPFETADVDNEEGNWKRLQNWCNFAYIPASLILRSATGEAMWYYCNSTIRDAKSLDAEPHWYRTGGYFGDFLFCYYDLADRKSSSGLGGWQTNRRIIPYYRDGLPGYFTKQSGQIIEMPPEAGYLELVIGSNLSQFDYGKEGKDIYSRLRWALYKQPKIRIVQSNAQDINSEDVEDSAWINRDAKEELKIDTIFGTMPTTIPTARGLLFDGDMRPYKTFYRAGTTARLEHLLIGTVYSQYASRKHKLGGTIKLIPSFCTYRDASQSGEYMMLSEVQHLINDESEIDVSQFVADNYEGIEYKAE